MITSNGSNRRSDTTTRCCGGSIDNNESNGEEKMKTAGTYLLATVVLVLSLIITTWYIYSQRYVQDGANTATTGIYFKTTLNLDEYKNVSSGNGWLGKFERYTRSDRHSDVLTIYCKEYCKK